VDRWDPVTPPSQAVADPPGSGAPRRVIRRVSGHARCSWLKAAALAATSAPGAVLQPSNT
jgi:hypothetical protein